MNISVILLLTLLSFNVFAGKIDFDKLNRSTVYHDCEDKNKQTELFSLACAIYHEARGEPLAGKIGVGFVVINRVASSRFPDTITDVVYQKSQLSWTNDGLSDRVRELDSWNSCLQIARSIMILTSWEITFYDITEGALFYHNVNINPDWAGEDYATVRINNHIFYYSDLKK